MKTPTGRVQNSQQRKQLIYNLKTTERDLHDTKRYRAGITE